MKNIGFEIRFHWLVIAWMRLKYKFIKHKPKAFRAFLFIRNGPYMTLDEFMIFLLASVITIAFVMAVITIELLRT